LYLLYNASFEYILITIYNEETLGYKAGAHMVDFSHFPFVIVNPFKKQILLDKIYKYCISEKFKLYYNINNYDDVSYNFFYFQKLSIQKKLVIESLKNEGNNLLILATKKNYPGVEIVFILDKKKDEIIGYF